MKFICVQPDTDYYVWQVQVLLNNFKHLDIERQAIIIFGYENEINPNTIKAFSGSSASFFFLKENRKDKTYVSSIRPFLLKHFFRQVQIDDDLFYHDCDILFRELPTLQSNTVQLSDCDYLTAKYIESKGRGLLEEMCAVVGISPSTVRAKEKTVGGAQYFIPKSVKMDYNFWNKVEQDSTALFKLMNDTAHIYNPEHPIQSWTADMWALLWNFWLTGNNTEVNTDLNFSWATMPISYWNDYKIFHNAGATPDRPELFYKAQFITSSPFAMDHNQVSDKYCSYHYVQAIKQTAKSIYG